MTESIKKQNFLSLEQLLPFLPVFRFSPSDGSMWIRPRLAIRRGLAIFCHLSAGEGSVSLSQPTCLSFCLSSSSFSPSAKRSTQMLPLKRRTSAHSLLSTSFFYPLVVCHLLLSFPPFSPFSSFVGSFMFSSPFFPVLHSLPQFFGVFQ